eukprot:jgi/Mesvir1/13049/Mv06037-RA.1
MSKFLSMALRLRLASSASSRRSWLLLLELCCNGGGGGGGVLLKHVRPGLGGRSIASRASGGWLGGNVLHRLGGEACGVLQDLDMAMALSWRRWSMSRSWAVMASEKGVVAVEEARRVEVTVEMVDREERPELGSPCCPWPPHLQRWGPRAARGPP